MQPFARLLQNPSTNPDAFDYRRTIHSNVENGRGLPEGAVLVTDPVSIQKPNLDLVVSFQATDAAAFGIEVLTSSPDGNFWVAALLPTGDPKESSAKQVPQPAAEQRVYRLQLPEGAVSFRFVAKALRVCNRVDIYSQVR